MASIAYKEPFRSSPFKGHDVFNPMRPSVKGRIGAALRAGQFAWRHRKAIGKIGASIVGAGSSATFNGAEPVNDQLPKTYRPVFRGNGSYGRKRKQNNKRSKSKSRRGQCCCCTCRK